MVYRTGWWAGRRRHGTLGLPDPTRREQRLSWLDRDLRRRRGELLRRHWRVLLPPTTAFVGAAAGPAVALREQPFLLGVVLGCFAGAMAVGGAVFLHVLDGTLMARLGRMFERDVGRELRETAGVYGVVSDVSFETSNVDHVVLCPRGVLAVEVKGLLGRRQSREALRERHDMAPQAQRGAQKIRGLLRTGHLHEVPVVPVLVLAGPGVPALDAGEQIAGVRALAFRDSDDWRPLLSGPDRPVALDEATARKVADVLLEHTRMRSDHEHKQAHADRRSEGVPSQRRRILRVASRPSSTSSPTCPPLPGR